MEAYWLEWLNLLGRWLHFIVGIAWVGSSLYFVWLDNHLLPVANPSDDLKGVGGEIWSVHGGGFYHAQKYRVAPAKLPEVLHWFKWEAYTTWMSGMFLLALIYWYGAEVYLVDQSVFELSAGTAVVIAVTFLLGGWLIYDVLCKSPLAKNEAILGGVLFALLTAAAWGLCQLFSGRGAYIHFGAMIGTIMVANVFFVIIPGQRRMVSAAQDGRAVDPADGLEGKQRSVHNTYLTLPVLFVMISNHYAMTYGHQFNWLILIGISLAGALIRTYFVARHKGQASLLPAVIAIVILVGISFAIVPRTGGPNSSAIIPPPSATATAGAIVGSTSPATFENVISIIQQRCTTCHSEQPTFAGFPAAPGGVKLEAPDQIAKESQRIHQQVVLTRVMPIGNLTKMQEDERLIIDQWYRDGGRTDWIANH